MSAHLRTAIVAPMTTGSRPAGFRTPITFEGRTGLLLPDQIRALDRQRPVGHLGTAAPATVRETLRRLQVLVAA